MEMAEALQAPENHPELKLPLYIMQGFATFVGLIIAPAWFLYTENKSIKHFFVAQRAELIPVIITVVTVIVFMAVNSIFIEWNSTFHFPDALKGFESWAREREDEATRLTTFLTQFDSTPELAIAVVVIAMLPAVGEELVFRGMIQNNLFSATKNIHISIWISAILFSAIHLQFFGFVPRLLLGALFGYLYFWSGNLSLAMLAHFVNNGISVIAMYFYQRGALDLDVESTEAAPVNVIIFSVLATAGLLYYFYKYFETRKTRSHQL
ncbi:MAG: CPBP family intramembrane glutamic endopeptidase [Bacteroidota bacterium]